MKCLFCDIVQGSAPSYVVYDNEFAMAFLDTRPLFPGHVLLVPRKHFDTLNDVPPDLIGPLFQTAQRLAQAVETVMHAEGNFIAINNRVSQSVPHLHIHVVPRRKGDGLKGFFWPRSKYTSEAQAAEIATSIRKALE